MKVAVYGAGGVGAYFGGRLAQAGAEVHLIARGEHLRALRERGLTVRSTFGDFQAALSATDDPADIGRCDYVLFTVKSYDTDAAASRLAPLIGDETLVLSLQNGVDNEATLAASIGEERVLGGATFILSTVEEPGVIAHTAGPARIVFGEFGEKRSAGGAERLLEWFEKAQVEAQLSEQIEAVLWDKFAFVCAVSGMTAASRSPIGEIRDVPESWAMFRRISEEVCALAAAEGVPLPAGAAQEHVDFAANLHESSLSSLHYDLVHGKRMELEALHGAVVRRAAAHGLAVPMCFAAYALLKPQAIRFGT